MPLTMKCKTEKKNENIEEKCDIMDGDQQIATLEFRKKGTDPKQMDTSLNFKSNVGGIQTFESFSKTQSAEDLKRIDEIDTEIDKLVNERRALMPRRLFSPFFDDFYLF